MPAMHLQICDRYRGLLEMKMNPPAISSEAEFPIGIAPLDSQVAGHSFSDGTNTIGMLKSQDGSVLKPLEKPLICEREIKFYEELYASTDPLMLQLRQYTPQYYGTTDLQLRNKRVKFLVLEDITKGMTEPCIMDIKIGKRTWDPLAGAAKRSREDNKYAESKNEYGFCIPGFQVYQLSSGSLLKYDKDYGKKLSKQGVIKAMEVFLNLLPGQRNCRHLVVQFLFALRNILAFFRSQTKLRFYSSSILLAYDAEHLRNTVRMEANSTECYSSHADYLSTLDRCLAAFNDYSKMLNNIWTSSMGHSGDCSTPKKNDSVSEKRLNNEFPLVTRLASSLPAVQSESSCKIERPRKLESSASDKESKSSPLACSLSVQKDCSLQLVMNGTEEKIVDGNKKVGQTQSHLTNFVKDHSSSVNGHFALPEESRKWFSVRMIDFAHVFPAEDDSLDSNYLEGIENLINLLETYFILE